jgi:hypothetical protein
MIRYLLMDALELSIIGATVFAFVILVSLFVGAI